MQDLILFDAQSKSRGVMTSHQALHFLTQSLSLILYFFTARHATEEPLSTLKKQSIGKLAF